MRDWWIFRGTREPHDAIKKLPSAPPWRMYAGNRASEALPDDRQAARPPGNEVRGATYLSSDAERDMVNAALYLRRPLLVTGGPGTGKSSLAYAVAYELNLGPVLRWPITSKTTLGDGLYRYDALGRLQATALHEPTSDIGRYLRLGPLGTAWGTSRPRRPRVLLIDEIDKSDIDLPNDLLHLFEEGQFEIPELARLPEGAEYDRVSIRTSDDSGGVTVERGQVSCHEFPFVVLTSNGERDFSPAFLRRCLRLGITPPDPEKLARIVEQHLDLAPRDQPADLVEDFLARQAHLATDQLLNAIYLTMHDVDLSADVALRAALLKGLEPEGS